MSGYLFRSDRSIIVCNVVYLGFEYAYQGIESSCARGRTQRAIPIPVILFALSEGMNREECGVVKFQ